MAGSKVGARTIRTLKTGDPVIYIKHKRSPRPGPRAEDIRPAEHGEDYDYTVDKYWAVKSLREEDGTVELVTRRGKVNRIRLDDPNLRRPNFLERWLHRNDFPEHHTNQGGEPS